MSRSRTSFGVSVVAVALALLSVGCSSDSADTTAAPAATTTTTAPTTTTTVTTTTTPTTTTTQATTTTISQEELDQQQYEADVVLIKELWRDYSDSWFDGVDAGYEFLATHTYGSYECTAEDFEDLWQAVDGFQEEAILDVDSVERDDGWVVPGSGPGTGGVPNGRIYIMKLDYTTSAPGYDTDTFTTESHVTVDTQVARFFFPCRDD